MLEHAGTRPVASGSAVRVEGLGHEYPGVDGRPLVVLDSLDLDLAPSSHTAVTGRSGAGKSTLLAVLGGLEHPQSGSVHVAGLDLGVLDSDGLARYRRETVGFVFQHFGLLGNLTAAENVELPMTFSGMRGPARRRRAHELLDAVGLTPRAEHRPAALSGGESQRVAIARALANDPLLVLADEPTGNLDDEATDRVLDVLGALPGARGCTVVVVTHDRTVAARADTTLRLDHGSLRPG